MKVNHLKLEDDLLTEQDPTGSGERHLSIGVKVCVRILLQPCQICVEDALYVVACVIGNTRGDTKVWVVSRT